MLKISELHNAEDYVLRTIAADGMIRGFFANTRKTVNTATDIHNTTAVMSAALGRLLTAGAIMGMMLKNDRDLLTMSVKGDGPGGGLLVTADSKGHVKGYPNNPYADVPNKPDGKLDVSRVIGNGSLTVIKDMGFKKPHSGTVKLQTGEIAEDITYYFAQSEQTPSVVSLGVLVDVDYSIKQAGGFIIQLMPGASEKVISYVERKIDGLNNLTHLYEQGHTPETLAEMLFSEIDYKVLDKLPVDYSCDCSWERAERALISIGKDELKKIIEEDKSTSLNCHFCNKQYQFNEIDLFKLVKEGAIKF